MEATQRFSIIGTCRPTCKRRAFCHYLGLEWSYWRMRVPRHCFERLEALQMYLVENLWRSKLQWLWTVLGQNISTEQLEKHNSRWLHSNQCSNLKWAPSNSLPHWCTASDRFSWSLAFSRLESLGQLLLSLRVDDVRECNRPVEWVNRVGANLNREKKKNIKIADKTEK